MGALSRAPASSRTHGESRSSRNAAASVTIVGAGATLYGRAGIGEAIGPLEPPRQGPVAQWLEPAAHNGLVGGSSPPGPTTQSHVWGNFPAAGEKPPDGGMRREGLVSVTCDLDLEGGLGALFSGLEFRFPERA